MQCATATNACCLGSGSSATCQAETAACTGNKQECDEASDCPSGQIRRLKVARSISGAFTMTCQTGTTCPTGLASAQICKTNAECSTGTCSLYSCEGNITEACQSPSTFECTKM